MYYASELTSFSNIHQADRWNIYWPILHKVNCFYGVREKCYTLLQIVGETEIHGLTPKKGEGGLRV